ncbi:MAG: tetratricopeptide repeat protein [Promethearchaeota archaeon]
MDENIAHLESKELTQAEKLIDEGMYDEALQLIENFERMKCLTLQDKVSCRLLKCNLLFWQWRFEKMLKIADQTYKESLELEKNLQSVDTLILSAKALRSLGREEEAIKVINQAEELLKCFTKELPEDYMQREAHIYLAKGKRCPSNSYKIDDQLKFLEQSLGLGEKLGNFAIIAESLFDIAFILGNSKGELNHAIKYLKRSLLFAEECNSKYYIAMNLLFLMIFHMAKGELDQSLIYAEQCLPIFEKINNKQMIAGSFTQIGGIYRGKGNFDRALGYLERGLTIREELGISITTSITLTNLIEVAIDIGDLDLAQKYFNRLKQLHEQEESKWVNSIFRLSKAILLKTSPRARNRVKAEDILKQILKEKDLPIDFLINVLLNLCELLLTELNLTNEVEILEEINPYLTQLLNLSDKANSFWILGETYLLQAKLALVSLNLDEARRLLTKGQKIAGKYGLRLLARKISNEHDELLRRLDMWENLKESKASLTERMELARLNEQMENMIRTRGKTIPQVSDEQPVFLLIVSEGGRPIFSQSFLKDKSFEDHLFGGFFTTINSFINEKFSEGLDRAIFGEHTLLLNSISPFMVCYVYKGQSYSAHHRLKSFVNELKRNKGVWNTIEKFYQSNQEIQINNIPLLDSLVNDIFIKKNITLDLKQ